MEVPLARASSEMSAGQAPQPLSCVPYKRVVAPQMYTMASAPLTLLETKLPWTLSELSGGGSCIFLLLLLQARHRLSNLQEYRLPCSRCLWACLDREELDHGRGTGS